MRRAIAIAVFVLCAAGPIDAHPISSTRTVPISNVDQVELDVPVDLQVIQGDHESLVVTDNQKDMDRLRIRQDGSVLTMDTDDEVQTYFDGQRRVSATLTIKNLNALRLNTAGTVTIRSLNVQRLELSIAGAGSMDVINVKASAIDMEIAGVGQISATGEAEDVNVEVSGLGTASLSGLTCKSSHVEIAGGGSVKLFASSALDASITGLGVVRYWGHPRVTQAVSGIGSIKPMGL